MPGISVTDPDLYHPRGQILIYGVSRKYTYDLRFADNYYNLLIVDRAGLLLDFLRIALQNQGDLVSTHILGNVVRFVFVDQAAARNCLRAIKNFTRQLEPQAPDTTSPHL